MEINLKWYQEQAARTCPSLGSLEKDLLHMKLGVLTEIGELADIFKKNLVYSKPIDYVNLGEEIADVCWYLVNEDRIRDITYSDEDKPFRFTEHILKREEILTELLNYQLNYPYNTLNLMYNIAESFKNEGVDFYKCLQNNINKLKIRYPDKFDVEKALNRNLINERKELEK